MNRINTVEELEQKIASCTGCVDSKLTGADEKRHIVLCGGTGCLSSHSKDIKEKFIPSEDDIDIESLKEKTLDLENIELDSNVAEGGG